MSSATTQVPDKLQAWLAARPQAGPRWWQDLRDRAAARFTTLGLPTSRDEEWRFTPLGALASTEFVPAADGAIGAASVELPQYLYSGAGVRLVVVNGRYVPELSKVSGLPGGVRVGSLAVASAEHADPAGTVQRDLGQLADTSGRAFVALNTALFADGVYVHVPEQVVLDTAVHVVFITTDGTAKAPITWSPRSLIVAGARSQLRVVETFVGPQGAVYFSNGVTEIFAGEDAVIDHYKVQEESFDGFHIGATFVHALRSSNVSSHSFSLGGRFVRNDAVALLDGEGAECTLNGLYLADGERFVDNHTSIDHAKAHCPSHEIYKGILGGRARAVFNGKIMVRQDAQKTDAKQTNRALLLSDDASINTKPQLEIFADDVKCTHGAAIGQLDEDAIFYLRARGLTFFEARDLLIHAFAGEILDRVKIAPLKEGLETVLYSQLAKDLAEIDAR
jgi:Fe-S cluster assembly protein SufD